GEYVLDLDGMDVLAAADDHVVHAAGDPEVAVNVDPAHVAGEVPALAQRAGVGAGAIPVAGKRFVRREARDDLAALAGRHCLVGPDTPFGARSEEHTSELQSHSDLVCRL